MKLRNSNILIVDDDPDVLTAVRLFLKPQVKSIEFSKYPQEIKTLLKEKDFDVILLDMNFKSGIHSGNEGLFWLKEIKKIKPDTQVILITAYGDIDLAVRSLKEGAEDFILKPWQNEKLLQSLHDALVKKKGTPSSAISEVDPSVLTESDIMQDLLVKVKKVAPTDANVLILGENGSGKDVLANLIHFHSSRADKPFIKVDLGALSESLFASELFGHKKGSFTDAREDRVGRIEAAQGGTLFLDEIGNINLNQQAKLLTVIQNRHITRIGSNVPSNVDIRLICATNIPVTELANEQRFRRDLLYRINTVDMVIPPLRARGRDIEILANHFLKMYKEKYFKSDLKLGASAVAKLMSYSFPGNIRELQYTIERAVILCDMDVLTASEIIFSNIESNLPNEEMDDSKLSSVEKNTVIRVLEKHNGNISKAAKELGITRTALYRRLNKYDI
ncbi:MAG: sigma-54 dependent transcriptional regulator [Saprospiraceae bacterium]